ncbi:unnamed protein product, partial [Closterium sp. NIES-53]
SSSGSAHCEAAPKAALNPQQFVAFRVQQVQEISHNTKIFRFALDPDTRLGLTVASCLVTRAPIGPPGDDGKPKAVIRPYTPITPPDVTGHFDLLVKVYPDGKMSRHFFSLKPGDVLEMKGPIPKLPYQPNMKRSIGMVGGGTGITPMLQVIDAILSNPTDHTQVSLVFANTSPADTLLADQLTALAASHPNFKVYFMVDRAEAGAAWKGGVGFITADVLRKALPPPSPDSLVLVCGPPGMMNHVSGNKAPDKSQGEVDGLLKTLGYTKDQVYKYKNIILTTCGPRTAPAARSPPACGSPATPRPARRRCDPLAALAAHLPPLWPARCPYGPLAARMRLARRPCRPLAACSQPLLLVALLALPSLRGVPPPPLPPPMVLLLLLTSLVLRMSGLLLLLVGSAASAKATVARVVAVAAGVVVVEAVEAVEVAEVVAMVGVVAGVGSLVAVAVEAVGVAVVAAVGVVALEVELFKGERGASGGCVSCPYVIRTGDCAGQTCGKPHTQHRCFSRPDDAWCAEFGDEAERPRWAELLRSGVAIFDLDYDAILAAIYALSVSAEGDCYRCVPPDPGIEAAALGASESALPGTTPAEAVHTFTLDSGASRCSFCDSTTLTPLSAPVPVRLADPSGGPVLARSSIILLCPAYLCPPGCDGHYHHSWGSACVDLHVYTDGPSPGHVHPSAWVELSSGTTALVTPPYHAFVVCTPASLFLVFPGLCLPSRPRLPRPAFLASRGSSAPLLTPPRFPRRLLPCRLCTWTCRAQPASVDRTASATFCWLLMTTRSVSSSASGSAETFVSCACTLTERPIGLFMDVARTSMIHAADPHFLWPFAVRCAAHQLNLWPRVSLPATSFTLNWMGKVVDASVFWVWGSRAFVRDTSTDELSARAIPCVILGFPPDVLSWQFYHPTFRRVHPSQDVTFDESVPFYRLFPYRSAPLPPPPLFLVPVPPPVDPLPPQGPAPSGAARGAVSGGDVSGSSASRGAEPARAEPGGAEPGGTEPAGAKPRGAEPEGAEPGVAESEGAESEVSEPRGTASSGGPAGASPRQTPRPGPLSPQQLREWFSQRTRLRSGATEAGGSAAGGTGAGGAGATSLGGAGVPVGAGGTGGTRARDPGAGGAGARGTGAGDPVGTSVRGTGARGARAVDPGAGGAGAGGAASGGTGAGGTLQRRPFFVPPPLSSLPPPYSLLPYSPLPAPSPYAEQTDSPSERREPASHPALPVRAVRTSPSSASSSCPWLSRYVTLSFLFHCAFLCRLLPSPLFLPFLDPESDLARAASPTVSRLLATVVTDPSFESTAASALVAELVDFAAACRLDYATSLVAESECDYPPSVGGECALGTDVLEDRQEDFECLVAAVPHLVAMLLAPEGDPDAPDIPTLRSYAEAITVPPSGANIVDGMWIFRGVDFFQTFSPTPKMATLRVLLHVAAQRDYELSLDFSTAFLKSSLHEEIWLRRPPSFTGSFPAGIHRNLRRPVYGLRQAPREWHDTLRTTLAALGFAPRLLTCRCFCAPTLRCRCSTSLCTRDTPALTWVLQRFGFRYSWPQSTPLPTGHSLSAPPLDESVEPSGPYPEVVGCLITSCMGLVLGGRGPVVLTGHANASWVDDLAMQRSSQGYTFSLGSGSVSWLSTYSSFFSVPVVRLKSMQGPWLHRSYAGSPTC